MTCHLCGSKGCDCDCWEIVEEWDIPDEVIEGHYESPAAFDAAFEKALLKPKEN